MSRGREISGRPGSQAAPRAAFAHRGATRARGGSRGRAGLTTVGIAAALALCALGPIACGGVFLQEDPPERVSVDITSASVDSVMVVTSELFVLTDQGGEQLIEADSAVVLLPFQDEEDIRETQRFLIKVMPADPDAAEATVTLRVRVDGDVRFDRESDVVQDPLEFRFLFAGSG